MKRILILLILGMASAFAENLYVTPSGAGATNGSSWANAFAGFSDVAWGGAAGQVGAGDTLYVGAGTYNGTITIPEGTSGASGNVITIRAAQDTNTGVATFTGNFVMQRTQYFVFNGEFDGARNFTWTNLISANDSNHNEFGYFNFAPTVANNPRAAYDGNQLAIYQVQAFDQTLMHDGTVTLFGQINNHFGMDGIQSGVGYTYRNIVFLSQARGSPTNQQHQDLIQVQLGYPPYSKVIGCTFINTGDSMIDFDNNFGNNISHIQIYNCLFLHTVADMGTQDIRLYSNSTSITTADDIHIDNNTFVDAAIRINYGAAIMLQGWVPNPTVTNCSIQNNIFYNCGRPYDVLRLNPFTSQSGWTFTNNLVNAGSQGNTRLSGWTQTSGAQGGTPSFVSYSPYSASNDLHLNSNDTAARNLGADLSSRFTTDLDNATRILPWDIGADEITVAAPGSLSFSDIPLTSGLSFEAESGLIDTPFAISSGLVSQDTQTLTVAIGGRARYNVTIPATGSYTISMNVNAPDGGSDSCWVEWDAEPTDPTAIWDVIPLTSGIETRTVSWRGTGAFDAPQFNPKVWDLSAGEHTLYIRGREAGMQVDAITIVPQPSSQHSTAPKKLRIISIQ
jgi:hypothetical protein